MKGFKSYFTSQLNKDTQITFQDILQSPHPSEDKHETSTKSQRSGSGSSTEDQETFPDTKDLLGPIPLTLEESDEDLEVKDSDSASVLEQADRLEQMKIEPKGKPLSKPMRSFLEESLPDLLRNGKPLRRRVSSPVSDTLKQMRRDVELSRRRSIKLKAQVDKLQEQSQDGLVWSQQREQVTEEIQSIVKLLIPLTDVEVKADPSSESESLDTALTRLKNVARTIALKHTSQGNAKDGMTDESAVLQQALRDRDDALEKKKAMETELLKCKTELMSLNNQLLEAVQRRLEMAIELEAWKDDVQTILHHQLLTQQQAEQGQRKSKGFSVLRRSRQSSPIHSPVLRRAASPGSLHPNTPVAQRWKDKLKRGRQSQYSSSVYSGSDSPNQLDPSPLSSKEDSFQTVSLD